jgi:uncharacterized protein (TIGR03067 family)
MVLRLAQAVAVVVLCGTAGPPAAAQEANKAPAELQGTWKIVSLEVDGEREPELDLRMPRWVIKGTQVRFGGEKLADLAVTGTASPRSLDLTFVRPKKRVLEAVYKVEGDTLTICVNTLTDGVKERPDGFATKDKAGRRVLILQRQKDGTDDGSANAPGFVGIMIRMDDETKAVSIGDVIEGTPAEKAGLKKDDVLLRLGTDAVTDLKNTVETIRQVRPGSDLTVRVRRGDKEQDVKVKVGVMPFFLFD